MSNTPSVGLAYQTINGNQPLKIANGGWVGGLLTNPSTAEDQGLDTAEDMFVDCVGQCAQLAAFGTVFRLTPGDTWSFVPDQTTETWVNALSPGHRFTVVVW